MTRPTVSSPWLNTHLADPDLIILDASPKSNKSGLEAEFEGIQIRGARQFDIKNKFSDLSSAFPNTLPSAEQFEAGCRALGINKSSKIVVYDKLGIYTSPRVWWMLHTMGHEAVAVLDGGLPDWVAQGYATESIQSRDFTVGDFEAHLQPQNVKDIAFMKANIKTQDMLVVDARSAGRFNGTTPEPRKGLRGGNIPNSVNIPFQSILENGKLKSKYEIRQRFAEAGATEEPLVFSCGSGITACVLLLASELILDNERVIYDGSWTEWGVLMVND